MLLAVPPGYRALRETDVAAYLAQTPVVSRLGASRAEWRIREVGDGNLNLVFVVEGPRGGVVLKQALPYVRLVGESWPLSPERARSESDALAIEARLCPDLVPRLYHYDAALYLTVMEDLRDAIAE